MRRFRVYFVILTAFVIAAVPMKEVVCAAQVIKINGSRGHIYIDAGNDPAYIMGAPVCFYSFSGELILCGTVRQITGIRVMVKVKNRETKLIKKGMTARVMTGDEE